MSGKTSHGIENWFDCLAGYPQSKLGRHTLSPVKTFVKPYQQSAITT